MTKTLLPIRVVFIALCASTGWLVCYTIREWDEFRILATFIGISIGVLVILVDLLLKGFSLRGLSALTFGLGVGSLISYLICTSPLFIEGDEQIVYLFRLALFLIVTYMSTVIAFRGRDEFNLVIPYVRFVPHEVDSSVVVVDTSALIDGRVARICESGFLSGALIIPRFVLEQLQRVADSAEPARQARGRRGLEVLASLRRLKQLDLRIHESEAKASEVDAKLVFLAQSMKAKLLTTDYNLAKMAEFHGVPWLNLKTLAKSMRRELLVGEPLEIDLVKTGREDHQGVGYLEDGSMVVVEEARALVGSRVTAQITSILPSAGGKLVFGRLVGPIE
ncbi:MAG: twitching motility protein PilT [Candidatus Synoicihabitans palmerolidicus]|nr:twitching motility protein PilT [Candidatus Synoicihabitans palmerolidicus]